MRYLYLLNSTVRAVLSVLRLATLVIRGNKFRVFATGVFLAASIVVILPQKTQAWTGTLPTCGTSPAAWEYKEHITTKYGSQWDPDVHAKNFTYSFDTEDSYPSGWGGAKYNLVIFYTDGTIHFNQSGSTKTVTTTGTSKYIHLIKDTANSKWQSDTDPTPNVGNATNLTSYGGFACIGYAKGATYDSDWIGAKFSQTPTQQVTDCSANSGISKVTCEIANFFDGVADTFLGVGKAIVGGIATLFLPDTDQIMVEVNDFFDYMEAKLGFLVYPFQFMGGIFNAFEDTEGHAFSCTSTSCNIGFGGGATFFGSGIGVDLTALNDVAPTLFSFIVNVIRGMTVFALIMMLRKKYTEVVAK